MPQRVVELIQYSPLTDTVYEKPLVITPPWINKYYILDLAPKKSFIRNLVSKGHTVFVVSWKNPTAEMREVGMDDYLMQGPVTALEVAQQITGAKQVHAVGYCIGGTLLASAMAWFNHPDNLKTNPVEDWTLLTSLVDFEHPGDLGVFINEDTLKHLEETMAEQGYLDGKQMGTTMRMLRPVELIGYFFINNYLYGKQPPSIDMPFWNDDSTRMPEAMHKFYLRQYYLHNKLRNPMVSHWPDIPSTYAASSSPSTALRRKRITSRRGRRCTRSTSWCKGRCASCSRPPDTSPGSSILRWTRPSAATGRETGMPNSLRKRGRLSKRR